MRTLTVGSLMNRSLGLAAVVGGTTDVAAATVARRYAEACFRLAEQADDVAGRRDHLVRAVETLGHGDVASALANPRRPIRDRVGLALGLLDGVGAETRNLVRMLIERGRIGQIGDVLTEYDRLADVAGGLVRAEVVAAIPIDDVLASRIRDRLADRLNATVETTFRLDPDIVGGLVIRVGEWVIDDSLATHLQQLRAAFR